MKILYLVGVNPIRETVEAFGVGAYPETFIIDEQGIIKWRGSPFDLNEKMLEEALGYSNNNYKTFENSLEVPNENTAYTFTLKVHQLEMGAASYYHYNPFDINIFNNNVEDMLKVFYGINKSRILTKDSLLLNTTYDITLKADKDLQQKPIV